MYCRFLTFGSQHVPRKEILVGPRPTATCHTFSPEEFAGLGRKQFIRVSHFLQQRGTGEFMGSKFIILFMYNVVVSLTHVEILFLAKEARIQRFDIVRNRPNESVVWTSNSGG